MLSLNRLIQESTAEIQIKKLIDRLQIFAQQKHLSEIETNNRINWVLRFIRFHNGQHPINLNQSDLESFLSSLASEHNYGPAIQDNAVIALKFLYQDFLQIELDKLQYIQTKSRRGFIDRYGDLHCRAVLNHLQGTSSLMAELVVAGKLKLNEVVNLKVADINIKKNRIHIRQKNGEIKFTLNIPLKLILDLRIQMMRVRQLVQIKTQQFSEITQPELTPLSDTSQLIPTNKKDEYLFPVANIENPHISSRAMQLALLKNDLKIATKQYLRFSNDSSSKLVKASSPIQFAANDTVKYMRDRQTEQQKFKLVNLSAQDFQASFNFKLDSKQQKFELGVA